MLRAAVPVAHWMDAADPATGPLNPVITRLLAGADRIIPAGRRAVTITVMSAAGITSPIVTVSAVAVVLPSGEQLVMSGDFPADTLPAITVTTIAGDDVLIVETIAT